MDEATSRDVLPGSLWGTSPGTAAPLLDLSAGSGSAGAATGRLHGPDGTAYGLSPYFRLSIATSDAKWRAQHFL